MAPDKLEALETMVWSYWTQYVYSKAEIWEKTKERFPKVSYPTFNRIYNSYNKRT